MHSMKFVFFLSLLINIIFFLWEYRKGAPDIYLPPTFEYSKSDTQKIVLLKATMTIDASKTLIACYQLNQTVTKKDFISQTDIKQKYTLAFAEEEVPYISNYLVLTLPVDTF